MSLFPVRHSFDIVTRRNGPLWAGTFRPERKTASVSRFGNSRCPHSSRLGNLCFGSLCAHTLPSGHQSIHPVSAMAGILFKSANTRDGVVQGIRVSNVEMTGVARPV